MDEGKMETRTADTINSQSDRRGSGYMPIYQVLLYIKIIIARILFIYLFCLSIDSHVV